jgi:hypothetical protein
MNAGTEASDDATAKAANRSAVFLNNLEGWLDEIVSRDGLADKELIKMIREKFECSLQANIDHHRFMMNCASENGDQVKGNRHKLMAEIYQELLPSKKQSTA